MASTTGGKVGNMRALFEAKQETSSSPPSRGRSPAGSDINSIRSVSSRPTSKIRSSFVVVEKAGTMGPMLGLRRISDVQDNPVIDTEAREFGVRSTSNIGRDSIAEEEELAKAATDTQNVAKGIEENKKPGQSSKEGSASSKEKNSSTTASVSTQQGKRTIRHTPGAIRTTAKADNSKTNGSGSPSIKRQPATPKELPVRNKAEARKPAAIRSSPAPKSPQTTSSTKAQSPTKSSRKSGITSISRIKQEPMSKPASRTSTPRTSLAPNTAKENKTIKTKPKSPTRPARLPAAAMASTASSAAKTSTADKASSHGSEKPRVSTDNDFLARMMRPTAASASKVHEKHVSSAISPPKALPSKTKRISGVSGKRISDVSTRATNGLAHSDLEPAQDENEAKSAEEQLSEHEVTENSEQATTPDTSSNPEVVDLAAKNDQSFEHGSHELDDQIGTNAIPDNETHTTAEDHTSINNDSVLQQSNDGTETGDVESEATHNSKETATDGDSSNFAQEIEDSPAPPVALEKAQENEDVSVDSANPMAVSEQHSNIAEDIVDEIISKTANGSASTTALPDMDDDKDKSIVSQREEAYSAADASSTSHVLFFLNNSDNKA